MPGERPGPGEAITRLEALAAELDGRGWPARLGAPPGRLPRLRAANPDAAALAENIYAQPVADGTWWYWWPWAEPIAAEPAGAAEVITRALRAVTAAGPTP
ncbi:MAG TPA: hypothetical protein VMV92_09165 [Streptosporangiaceae bacterium]|nr:hypothetical protein [Streptosporangiaceae bacterium]HVB45309.1 hypothetical protein [Streptosporangiaceae bacterium]